MIKAFFNKIRTFLSMAFSKNLNYGVEKNIHFFKKNFSSQSHLKLIDKDQKQLLIEFLVLFGWEKNYFLEKSDFLKVLFFTIKQGQRLGNIVDFLRRNFSANPW